eukprot:403346733
MNRLRINYSSVILTLLAALNLAQSQDIAYQGNFQSGSYAKIEIVNKNAIKFTVQVRNNQYLAFGYGRSMSNTDMVIFQGSNPPQVLDTFSYGYGTPQTDSVNNYQIISSTNNATHANIVVQRPLNTGDNLDKVVTLGQNLDICWAYATRTWSVVQHENRGSFLLALQTDGTVTYLGDTTTRDSQGKIHGWLLWAAWTVLGFIQIVSNRYLKVFWKVHLWVHRLAGTAILVITIVMSIIGIKRMDWKLKDEPHFILGLIVFFGITFLSVGGIITKSTMNRLKWKTHTILTLKFIHKSYGYCLLLIGQYAVLSGIRQYNERYYEDSNLWIPNIVCFFALWLVAEIIFQIIRLQESAFKETNTIITTNEFDQRIKQGHKLVILDDLVLDVTKFMSNHPGGQFVIEANVGRDISKFFYGGYQLENYTSMSTYHTHSNVARLVVNSLIIGRLEKKVPTFQAQIVERTKVNEVTQTIRFQAAQPIEGLKQYYKDLSMMGKHFLVRSMKNRSVRRHYTVSNCMQKEAYQMYLGLLNGDTKMQSEHTLKEEDSQTFVITSKNYQSKSGVSRRLNDLNNQDPFEIKGPLGKGLQLQPDGTHIAFTAGTAVLVFVDLVAHLIRKNLGLLPPDEDSLINKSGFKLILFVSFPNEKESIAYELCQGLQRLCKDKNIDNFELHTRFSNNSKERWDDQFIENALKKHVQNLRRLWVCGPPRMNEDFHKCLEKLTKTLGIDKNCYEIM